MLMKSLVVAMLGFSAIAAVAQESKVNGAAFSPPWTTAELITPGDLARHFKPQLDLEASVLQVGFANLYKVKHIPGAVYAGPASRDLEPLKKAVAGIPKDREIVIYCGCCPWDHCPNMKPAYAALRSLGYTRIKVMKINDNFGVDWVDKGYPVEGSAAK